MVVRTFLERAQETPEIDRLEAVVASLRNGMKPDTGYVSEVVRRVGAGYDSGLIDDVTYFGLVRGLKDGRYLQHELDRIRDALQRLEASAESAKEAENPHKRSQRREDYRAACRELEEFSRTRTSVV